MIRGEFEAKFGCLPEVVARAPGRIEFIGNHTDYNGGSVIGATIGFDVQFAATTRKDGKVRLISASMEEEVLVDGGEVRPLSGPGAWANYPLGVRRELSRAGYPVDSGLNGLVVSDLASGAGMSSSAALELSAAYAIASLHGITVDRAEMVKLCRRAENEFVGVPCGMLDQGVSAFGGCDRLVHIDCGSEKVTPIALPPGCSFWIFNTGVKHALVDSKYAERHRECREAYELLKATGSSADCLALVAPSFVRSERMRLGETLYHRALHVTEENQRVARAVEALAEGDLKSVGALLAESHVSSRDNFQNSCEELDFVVDRIGDIDGVYGARLSGGGFGGAVMAMVATGADFSDRVSVINGQYCSRFGHRFDALPVELGVGAGVVVED